jgi:hypothetical protein
MKCRFKKIRHSNKFVTELPKRTHSSSGVLTFHISQKGKGSWKRKAFHSRQKHVTASEKYVTLQSYVIASTTFIWNILLFTQYLSVCEYISVFGHKAVLNKPELFLCIFK